jgi:hypothetical protein
MLIPSRKSDSIKMAYINEGRNKAMPGMPIKSARRSRSANTK